MSRSFTHAPFKTLQPFGSAVFWGVLAVAAFWLVGVEMALAQTPAVSGMHDVQSNLARNARNLPKLVSVIAYICGAFFAVAALLKLKDWVTDSERNTFKAALMRLVVAMWLVMLPHIFVLVNGTFFGKQAGGATVSTGSTNIPPPKMSIFCKSGSAC